MIKNQRVCWKTHCTTSSSKQLVSLLLRCQRASHCPASKVSFSPRDRHSLGIEADLKAWSGRPAAGQQRRLNYFTSVRSRLTSDTTNNNSNSNNNNNNTELHRHIMMCLWGPPKKNTTMSFLYPKRYMCLPHIEDATRWCCFRRQIADFAAGASPEILGTHEERLLAAHRVGHLGLALTRPLRRSCGG